jgi:hypothetical protein
MYILLLGKTAENIRCASTKSGIGGNAYGKKQSCGQEVCP